MNNDHRGKSVSTAAGYGLIVLGLVLAQLATAAFTATAPNPSWLETLGGIGFWGWWIFVLVGVILWRRGRR